MRYRKTPYLIAHTTPPSDPNAHEVPPPIDRTHGIRYIGKVEPPENCIRSYRPSEAVKPAKRLVSAGHNPHPTLSDIAPKRLAAGILALIALIVVSALLGIVSARALTGYLDQSFASAFGVATTNTTRASSLSEAQSSWQEGHVPALYQEDPEWADRPYGPSTMGAAGAAPLCLAMVRIEETGDLQTGPIEVASFSQRNGLADSPDATSLLTNGAYDLGLVAHSVGINELSIRRQINAGHPLIAAVDPGAFGTNPTYLVLCEVNEYGKLVIQDPQSSERSKRSWAFDEITSCTTALWAYTSLE